MSRISNSYLNSINFFVIVVLSYCKNYRGNMYNDASFVHVFSCIYSCFLCLTVLGVYTSYKPHVTGLGVLNVIWQSQAGAREIQPTYF